MVAVDGAIVQRASHPMHNLVTTVDLSKLCADHQVSWDTFLAQVDTCLTDSDNRDRGAY